LSDEDGDKHVDNVDVEATWQALESRAGSQLIDVRTRAEWTYVGMPDLGSLSKRAILKGRLMTKGIEAPSEVGRRLVFPGCKASGGPGAPGTSASVFETIAPHVQNTHQR
jgi:hypothetical protein